MSQPGNGPFQPGDRFLKYEIGRLLGKGGHAFVYEATHLFLRRVDAIKIIPPPRELGRDLARRAEAEAQVLARLEHENIVKVYDAGGTAEGLVYIVMERLTGRTLRDALKAMERLTPAEALLIAEQVGSAVHAAHQQGVIHRDLKPENVFLVAGNSVKVLDFGIAKVLEHGAPTTQKDLLQGTVLYMSPEQLQAQRVTPRSDIFSLGTMLFEALHRHPALLRETPTLQELGWIQISRMPPPLSQLDETIPRFVARFVHRAIMKSPEQRYASMAELAEAARSARERHAREVLAATRVTPTIRDLSGSREGAAGTNRTRISATGHGSESATWRQKARLTATERLDSLIPHVGPASAPTRTLTPRPAQVRGLRALGSALARQPARNVSIVAALLGLAVGSGHGLFDWWSDARARDHRVRAEAQTRVAAAKGQLQTPALERTQAPAVALPPPVRSSAAPMSSVANAEPSRLAVHTSTPPVAKRALAPPRMRPIKTKLEDDRTPWLSDPEEPGPPNSPGGTHRSSR